MSAGILRATPKPRKSRKPKPAGLKRSRMKRYNAKRKGHAFPKSVRPEYRDFVRGQPCAIRNRWEQRGYHSVWCGIEPLDRQHECVGPVQACHVKSRGAGGADFANLYPGCAAAHHEQHAIGIPAFEKRWGVNLRKIAEQLYHDFLKSGGSGDPNP